MNGEEMKSLSRDAVLLFILSKVDQYSGEKGFFENKYRREFHEVEQEAHSVRGREDFKVEEDLEDWEFAIKSLEYWGKQKNYKTVG